MIADGNGFRTVRVPKHADYYLLSGAARLRAHAPRGGAISATVCASVLESPLDQCAAMGILRSL
jgi:hypothetical protein